MTDGLLTSELAEGLENLFNGQFDSQALHTFVDGTDLRQPELLDMAAEAGCFVLALPERLDGLGLSMSELVPIYTVTGAFMPPIPLFMSALAADVLNRAEAHVGLAELAQGAKVAVSLPPWMSVPRLDKSGEGYVLNGGLPFLLDGGDANLVLARAELDDGSAWIICETGSQGMHLKIISLIDETRHAANVTFENVQIPSQSILARGKVAREIDRHVGSHAALAIAADSVGGARAILERTVDYLKVREQFGRPIGSFQALKHRAANMHLMLASSRALLEEAVAAQSDGACDAAMLASLACAHAAEAYARIAEDAVQLHGGIGFTREHDAHLFLKRAKLNQALLGGTNALLDEAACFGR